MKNLTGDKIEKMDLIYRSINDTENAQFDPESQLKGIIIWVKLFNNTEKYFNSDFSTRFWPFLAF